MADTGQWRLEATLWRGGISARLCAIDRPGVPPRPLLDAQWRPDEEGLLQRLENAVYDNPQVLDDYTARILVDTAAVTWMPAESLPDDLTGAERFAEMFGGDPADVMCDEVTVAGHRMTAFYVLCPGLKAFLGRTFPGARIRCCQTEAVAAADHAGTESTENHVLVDCGSRHTHIIVLGPQGLLSASTRPECTPPDMVYHMLHALAVARIDPASARIQVSGIPEARDAVLAILSDFTASASSADGR